MKQPEISHDKSVLQLDGITKIFPGVKALDNVTMNLKFGEVLALVGENGAGKSTLINCISGVFRPESGQIRINGEEVSLNNPQAAFSHGISVVHQERNLIPTFNVAENIFLDRICSQPFKTVDRKQMQKDALALLERVKLDVDPTSGIEELSSAQKQMIEVARALSIHSHIVLLDEPTASISIKEADSLLDTIRQLRNQGVAIIYVSHKLEEIFAIADRVKVIRDGRSIGDEEPISNMTRDILIERMVGQRELLQAFPSHNRDDAETVLKVDQIHSAVRPEKNSFSLRKGEILGWYGLVGAGRTELARQVIGIDPIAGGTIIVNGKVARMPSYKEAYEKHRISYLSENRKEEGLFITHSISRNVSIVALDRTKNKFGMHSYKKQEQLTGQFKDLLKIQMRSGESVVSSLSGGNQQKVCIAKCLVIDPEIIIFDEPTVGIDVGTKLEIHKLIYSLSQQGKSIILISSDLPELIQLAERIQVFRSGKIVGELMNTKDYDTVSSHVMEIMLNEKKVGNHEHEETI